MQMQATGMPVADAGRTERMLKRVLNRLGAFVLVGCMVVPAAAAEQQYMAVGLPFFPPYRVAIVKLEMHDASVKGALSPPVGDPRPSLPLSGTVNKGLMELSITKGNEVYKVQLRQEDRGEQKLWVETGIVPGLEDVQLFRPDGGFSHPALALQRKNEAWCGLVHGGLAVTLRASDLRNMAHAPGDLASLNVVIVGADNMVKTVKLENVWTRMRMAAKSGHDVTFDITVPVGSEAPVAEKIRSLPAVAGVHLPNLCREMALAVIPSAKVMENGQLNDDRFRSYVTGILERQLAGQPPQEDKKARLRKFVISDVKIERKGTQPPRFSATITADAAATRGATGWDQFTLQITPVMTAADEEGTISLLVDVLDLRSTGKASAQIPAASAFHDQPDEAEAELAYHLVTWLAEAEDTRCAFTTTTSFSQPEEGFTCASLMLDDVVPAVTGE